MKTSISCLANAIQNKLSLKSIHDLTKIDGLAFLESPL